MNTQEMQQKFDALAKDEAFIHQFLSSETAEDAQKSLASQGIELSIEEVNTLAEAIVPGGESELSEKELTHVTGGFFGFLTTLTGFIGACRVAAEAGDYIGYNGAKWIHGLMKRRRR